MTPPKEETKTLALKENYTKMKIIFDTNKDKMQKYLGNVMQASRLMEIALFNIRKNPKLLECDAMSVYGAVAESAMMGIIPGDGTRKGDLIPYWNGKKGRTECQFQPRYGGLIFVAKNGNPTQWGHVEKATVHEKDVFEWQKGTNPFIKHIPYKGTDDPGKVTHFYSVVFLKDGTCTFEVMSKAEVDAIRARSKAKDNGPWVTDYEEHAEIRPLKRVLKLLPWESQSLSKVIDMSEKADAGIPQDNALLFSEEELGTAAIDVTPEEPKTTPTPTLGEPINNTPVPSKDENVIMDFKAAIDAASTEEEITKLANRGMELLKDTANKTLLYEYSKAAKKKLVKK